MMMMRSDDAVERRLGALVPLVLADLEGREARLARYALATRLCRLAAPPAKRQRSEVEERLVAPAEARLREAQRLTKVADQECQLARKALDVTTSLLQTREGLLVSATATADAAVQKALEPLVKDARQGVVVATRAANEAEEGASRGRALLAEAHDELKAAKCERNKLLLKGPSGALGDATERRLAAAGDHLLGVGGGGRNAKLLVVYDKRVLTHRQKEAHQESAGRVIGAAATAEALAVTFPDKIEVSPPRHFDREEVHRAVLLAHKPSYLEMLGKKVANLADDSSSVVTSFTDHSETQGNKHSLEAAYVAVQCVLHAVDATLAGERFAAFCIVRPPGHHAAADGASGFCLLANVAIGALYALERHKHTCTRVAVVDFDVHHGNGTQSILCEDKRKDQVLFCSVHAYLPKDDPQGDKVYPGTGGRDENRKGAVLNIPLSPPLEGADLFGRGNALDEICEELVAFQPDLVVLSAGFDAHKCDLAATDGGQSLGDLEYEDFRHLTAQLVDAAKHAGAIALVSVLEGGYGVQCNDSDERRQRLQGKASQLKPLTKCLEEHIKGIVGLEPGPS